MILDKNKIETNKWKLIRRNFTAKEKGLVQYF